MDIASTGIPSLSDILGYADPVSPSFGNLSFFQLFLCNEGKRISAPFLCSIFYRLILGGQLSCAYPDHLTLLGIREVGAALVQHIGVTLDRWLSGAEHSVVGYSAEVGTSWNRIGQLLDPLKHVSHRTEVI